MANYVLGMAESGRLRTLIGSPSFPQIPHTKVAKSAEERERQRCVAAGGGGEPRVHASVQCTRGADSREWGGKGRGNQARKNDEEEERWKGGLQTVPGFYF